MNLGNGAGFVNAPAGTPITVHDRVRPGHDHRQPVHSRSARPAAAPSTLNSATPGTTVVNASTTLTVSGVTLTRTTNGTSGNSGPATKLWADAAVRTDIHNAAHAVITTAPAG